MSKQNPQVLYADLMEEAKARFTVIGNVVQGKFGVPAAIICEFGFLQLRMLCELVALACLVAHGDVTSKLRNLWRADKMIAELGKLNPRFYPQPVNFAIGKGTSGERAITIDHNKQGGLTKEELIKLYHVSDQHVHRGTAERLFSSMPLGRVGALGPDLRQIIAATNKFVALLEMHVMSSSDMQKHMLVWLNDTNNHGRVSVILSWSWLFGQVGSEVKVYSDC